MDGRTRDLAMFNLAIGSKLRGCDVVALRVEDVAPSGVATARRLGQRPWPHSTAEGAGETDSLAEGEGFEPSVPLATVSLILAEEKGLQVDPARAGTAA